MNLRSPNELIQAARLAINNTARDPETGKKLAAHGFLPKRMQEGENLLTMVQEMQQDKKSRYDERWQISDEIAQQLQTLRPLFKDHVVAARFAFRHQPAILRTFGIQRISTNRWTWVAQATTFYQMMQDENYIEQMASHGITPEALQQAHTMVKGIMEMRDNQMYKKGEAEDTTESRNQASQQLRVWLKEFHATAHLALKDTPQKLEAYGIMVRSVQQ